MTMYTHRRLKRNFQEGPKSGPCVARVQSAEVHGLLAQFFPHSPSSAVEVTQLIRLAFPGCESQRDTKGHKETFYVGVERQMASLVSSSNSVESQLSFKDAQNEMLTARVNDLEAEV